MTATTNPKTISADEYIRLDFTWNTTCSGKTNRVSGSVENGSLDHMIYNMTIEVDSVNNETHVGIVTTETEIVDSEITAYEDEISRAMHEHLENPELGRPETIHVSAIVLGEADGARPVRESHPSIHFALHQSQYPDKLTAVALEKQARDKLGKQIDVVRAGGGFNVRIREPTITYEEAKLIKSLIVDAEDDILKNPIKTVYTAPQSGDLPDPKREKHHEVGNLTLEEKIEAAEQDTFKLLDGDGVVHWVDSFSHEDEEAFIHLDEGDTHRVTYDNMREFNFIPAYT